MSKKKKVSEKEVEKIASLSRLSLSKEELVSHTEDMNNILECAGDYNTKLPISNLIREMFKSLVEQSIKRRSI